MKNVAHLPVAAEGQLVTAELNHPTLCPPWCKDRSSPSAAHHFGPTMTAHFSQQHELVGEEAGKQSTLLRIELARLDEGDGQGRAAMWVQGETEVEMDEAEADSFIADLEALLLKARVLRRRMGGLPAPSPAPEPPA